MKAGEPNAKKSFREAFYARLSSGKPITQISREVDIAPDTFYSWQNPGKGLPDIYESLLIAASMGVSPSWLSFGDDSIPMTAHEQQMLEVLRELKGEKLQLAETMLAAMAGKLVLRLKGPPEMAINLPSTRDSLKRYKLSLAQRVDFSPVRHIEDLAAGYGNDSSFVPLENAYVSGVPKKGFTVARVRGDSMLRTLVNNDYVLLKDFPPEGYRLPRIERQEEKTPLEVWKRETGLQDGEIVVVDLQIGEGPTLKRVQYDLSRGESKWKMQIVADNPSAWRQAFQIDRGDEPVFYAKLLGLCETV